MVGLFSDRAVVEVDGRQVLLHVGTPGPRGIQLLEASSDAAVLRIDGRRVVAHLDGRVTARRHAAGTTEVEVRRDASGMYATVGSINGLPVAFVIDTGATQVALNAAQARRLGIDFRVNGVPSSVMTAAGPVAAWHVSLDRVKLGALELRNVDAVVLNGPQPARALLGMSFLGQLEITHSGELMTLRKTY